MDVQEVAAQLHARWRQKLAEAHAAGTPRADAEEQKAYDALIEFVEGNELNFSKFDPREA